MAFIDTTIVQALLDKTPKQMPANEFADCIIKAGILQGKTLNKILFMKMMKDDLVQKLILPNRTWRLNLIALYNEVGEDMMQFMRDNW